MSSYNYIGVTEIDGRGVTWDLRKTTNIISGHFNMGYEWTSL